MGSSGGGGTQSTTNITNADPWSGVQPYYTGAPASGIATGLLRTAYNTFMAGGTPSYGGDTMYNPYVTKSGQTSTYGLSQNLIKQRALNNPLSNAAEQGVTQFGTASDRMPFRQYQNTQWNAYRNPFLSGMFQNAVEDMSGTYKQNTLKTGQTAAESGRYGSGAWKDLQAINEANYQKQLGQMATNMYGNAYEQEAQRMYGSQQAGDQAANQATQADYARQMQALNMMPQLSEMNYKDLAALEGVGTQENLYNQAVLDDAIRKYEYQQNIPWENMNKYLGILSGVGAGSGTSQATASKPYYGQSALGKALAGGLGGAAAGAMIGSSISPGFGTALGAGVGGLAGAGISFIQ